jgi:pimeloyl-ACP methyl ester carboxylesterase
MSVDRSPLSRRAALLGAGAIAAAPALAPGVAQGAPPDIPPDAPFWTARYWATKERDGQQIRLALYRKRADEPTTGTSAKRVLFLVHGSSNAALSSFDLSVPGHHEYSYMNVFARLGYDVWAMDHEGYGASSRTEGNSDIASGVEDLRAAAEIVTRETGADAFNMLGQSSGALRAGAFAMAEPDRVRRLVLEAFTYTGKDSPTLSQRGKDLDYFRAHNRRPRDAAMIRSIFTRDRPGTTSPAVPRAIAAVELPYGDSVPDGTYLDMTAHLPIVDPLKVMCPVLVVRGQYDGIAAMADLEDFFAKLPNGDKQFSVIAGAAHAIGMSHNRAAYWHVVQGFLTIPPTIQS